MKYTTPSQINLSNFKKLYVYLYAFLKNCSFLFGTEKYIILEIFYIIFFLISSSYILIL